MAFKEDIEEAATEYLGKIEFTGDITPQEKADIIDSMKGDYIAGASQLAQFILQEMNEGKSLEDIKAHLQELAAETAG